MLPVPYFILFGLSFLLGSIPFAYIFVKKLRGIDIRTQGSGNVGATNAARVLGRKLGVAVLALDILKGVVAAGLFRMALEYWLDHLPLGNSASGVYAVFGPRATGLCFGAGAFLGHCYSPFLRFRGGKGVATLLGVYMVVAWKAVVLTLAVCAILILITRIVSIASITGAILLPAAVLVFYWGEYPDRHLWVLSIFFVTALMGGLVIFRHRDNIARLAAGTEERS